MPTPIPPAVVSFLPPGDARDTLRSAWLAYRREALDPDSDGGARITIRERRAFLRQLRQQRAELASQIREERREHVVMLLDEAQAFLSKHAAMLTALLSRGMITLGIDKNADGVISDEELRAVVELAAERIDDLIPLPPLADEMVDAVVLMALQRAAEALRSAYVTLGAA